MPRVVTTPPNHSNKAALSITTTTKYTITPPSSKNDAFSVKESVSSSSHHQKQAFKDIILANLCSNQNWTRDTSLVIPKSLPKENLPILQLKLNSHRGKQLIVFEGKEDPILCNNCLWLVAKLLPVQYKNNLIKVYEAVLVKMAERMVAKLEVLQPQKVNANLLSKTSDSELFLIFVVTFSSTYADA